MLEDSWQILKNCKQFWKIPEILKKQKKMAFFEQKTVENLGKFWKNLSSVCRGSAVFALGVAGRFWKMAKKMWQKWQMLTNRLQ